ncbi:glycoside hydrolase [Paraphoma chrysanthemicola]|uniref:Mannan endo-1,6-alpha-mannosidase n=1 Tax=Paraphoma chrysanthemicola TaxID=798071 RepID=A0A8K0QWV1_9PLEO|nr:glycoside hydrolase [Paraphoma chrysanthemicola]
MTPDSIKSAAKTLADSIVLMYNESLKTDQIPGLFPDPYYWWEAGSVFHGLIEYSYLTGDSRYDSLISEALQHQTGDYDAFMPPNQTKTLGNEDQSTWGLAAMTAAEVGLPNPPKDLQWLDLAVNVWNIQAMRYDDQERNGTCDGGLKWQIFTFNAGYNYKDSASNGNFFLLSARLAKYTGNTTYSEYADKVFRWSRAIRLVDEEYRVFSGTDDKANCTSMNRIRFTSTHGTYTEAAALMFNLTGAQTWREAVNGFVKSASVFQDSARTPIIVESACEANGKCSIDMRSYKGMFARTFARAALAAPFAADTILNILSTSATGAATGCTTRNANGTKCTFSWVNTTDEPVAGLGEVFNALEVVQVLLYPSAKGFKTANATAGGNATQSGGASRSSGAAAPQNTGAAGTVAASVTAVLVVAFATLLSM